MHSRCLKVKHKTILSFFAAQAGEKRSKGDQVPETDASETEIAMASNFSSTNIENNT